jgi:hypothetical protein
MGSRATRDRTEAKRYREAAELALEQLDWCINYLSRIRKSKIAQALQQNRKAIVKRHRL